MTSTGGGRFAGKVAIIAGSSRGIGLATARQLSAEGAGVVLNARHQEDLDTVVEEMRSAGSEVTGVASNLSAVETPARRDRSRPPHP